MHTRVRRAPQSSTNLISQGVQDAVSATRAASVAVAHAAAQHLPVAIATVINNASMASTAGVPAGTDQAEDSAPRVAGSTITNTTDTAVVQSARVANSSLVKSPVLVNSSAAANSAIAVERVTPTAAAAAAGGMPPSTTSASSEFIRASTSGPASAVDAGTESVPIGMPGGPTLG